MDSITNTYFDSTATYTWQDAEHTQLIRHDGVCIPLCTDIQDYNEYLRWIAAGNITTEYEIPIESLESKKSRLWTAAKTYQLNRLDDGGLAISAATVLAGRLAGCIYSKAQANLNWVTSLWDDYNIRRDALEADTSIDPDCDFSSHGELPYRFSDSLIADS